jgi:hypothetical protein
VRDEKLTDVRSARCLEHAMGGNVLEESEGQKDPTESLNRGSARSQSPLRGTQVLYGRSHQYR